MNRRCQQVQLRIVSFLIVATIITFFFPSAARAQIYLYDRADFLATPSPGGVAVADFNRDGRPDLAVSDWQNNWISILLASPKGDFLSAGTYATGFQPAKMAAADFNRDKKMDLAVVNANSATLSILLGNGDGTFQSRVDYPVGQGPAGIVAADFNSDGTIDLATVSLNDSAVAILLGDGNGGFDVQALIPVASGPSVMVGGDVNGDGKIDLITGTSNYQNPSLTVLVSKGDGTFAQIESPAPYYVGGLAVGDFNGDGKLDALIGLSYGGLYLSLGNGDGSFQDSVAISNAPNVYGQALLAGDFNHDGKLDLAVTGVWVMLGNGDGTFKNPVLFPAGNSVVAAADFNGDGQSDLAVTENSASVAVLLGRGDGNFMNATTVALASTYYTPFAGVADDFNSDGKLDMAVAEANYPNAQVSVELGKGNGKFKQPITSVLTSSAANPTNMLVADFNDDGKKDLIVLDDNGNGFQVLLGVGDGTFATPVDTSFTYSINSFAVRDFNGDGMADVAAAATYNNSSFAAIYLGNGDGTFSLGQQYVVYPYSYVKAADVNGDGHQDLIVNTVGYGSYNILVFLGNGDGTFKNPIFGPSDYYSSQAAVADFNGDGKLDIAVGTATYPSNGIAFLAGNGDGTFGPQVYSSLGFQFTGNLIASDFSGDGKLDLMGGVGCCGPAAMRIMSGAGDGTFGPPREYDFLSNGSYGQSAIAGDFNSDGTSDLGMPEQDPSYTPIVLLYLSAPTPNLHPTALDFGAVPVGQTSSPKKVKLTNAGNAKLKISSITVSGDFLEQGNCGNGLLVGKTCTIQVSFKPTAKGLRTGNLIIEDNASGSPHKVHLRGKGK